MFGRRKGFNMMRLLFMISILVSSQVFAISRVVNCRDWQTMNLELQFVLRGGVATVNVCPGDVCTENDMKYAQTLILQDNETSTLHYERTSGKSLPIRNSLDITFDEEGAGPVIVQIDQNDSGFNCY